MTEVLQGYSPPARFVIDLDAPPRERWKGVARAYLDHFEGVLAYIREVQIRDFGGEQIGPRFVSLLATCASWLSRAHTPAYLREELLGFAEVTASKGLDYDKLLLLNLGYDFLARCTSAIVEVKDKPPVHLRHMDWDCPALVNMVSKTTLRHNCCPRLTLMCGQVIDCEFQKGGLTVFRSVTWAGFVGVCTGMRLSLPHQASDAHSGLHDNDTKRETGGYSVSLNYRRTGPEAHLALNVLGGLCNHWPITFLLRNVLQTTADFRSALTQVEQAKLMAPCYITLCGSKSGEGAICTRDRHQARTQHLGSRASILVVSNIDSEHLDDPAFDVPAWAQGDELLLSAMSRSKQGTRTLAYLRAGDVSDLFDNKARPIANTWLNAWATFPLCNVQTNYAVLMSAGGGAMCETRVIKSPTLYTGRSSCALDSVIDTDPIRKSSEHTRWNWRSTTMRWTALTCLALFCWLVLSTT